MHVPTAPASPNDKLRNIYFVSREYGSIIVKKKLKKKQTETRVDQEPRGLGPRGEPILGDVVCVLGYRNMFSQGYFPCFTHLSRICFSIYKILS